MYTVSLFKEGYSVSFITTNVNIALGEQEDYEFLRYVMPPNHITINCPDAMDVNRKLDSFYLTPSCCNLRILDESNNSLYDIENVALQSVTWGIDDNDSINGLQVVFFWYGQWTLPPRKDPVQKINWIKSGF